MKKTYCKNIFLFALIVLFSKFNARAANYYWVGGSGNWSNHAVHWATASGGNVFHVQVPTSFDNVYFDANSFTAPGQIVTNDTTIAYCHDMDWTGVTNNPVFEAANSMIELKVFGSLTLSPLVNFTFNGRLTFTSFNIGNTIRTFSEVLQCPIEFNGAGGEWALLDSLTTTKNCTLTYGTVRTNSNNVRCNSFYSYSTNVRAIFLGTSTVSITQNVGGNWYVSRSLVIDADSSIIRFRDGGHFGSEGHTYNIIQWDSTGFLPTNYLQYDSLIINKVISYNSDPLSTLAFYYVRHIRIDTVIAMGSFHNHRGLWSYYNYIFVNHNAQLDEDEPDSIMKMIVNGNTTFGIGVGGGNNFVHDLTVGGNLLINHSQMTWPNQQNSQTFDSCRISGNASILSGSNHLGIFTMTPGKTLTFKNDSTQYIDSLSATGLPGFPIQVISSDLGIAANVVIQEDLCTDYLYIHAVHASSPNQLFVGINSNDVANNTGWIFNNCIIGVEENQVGSLSAYPNPATNEIRIESSEFKIQSVEIYNVLGEKVFQSQISNLKSQISLDISKLNSGIYFVSVGTNEGKVVRKLIKQ